MASDLRQRDRDLAKRKRQLADSEKRITELDTIFRRLYEDSISGKLSDERFQKLSADYEKEEQELKVLASSLRKEVELEESKSADVDRFLSVVERCTDIPELTPCILHEFVEKIIVHAAATRRARTGRRRSTFTTRYRSLGNVKSHGINEKKRKRYSRSYTVLSFLTMFSYRELPCRSFRFTLCFRSAPTDANPNLDRVCKHCECIHSCGFHQPNTKSRHFA